MIWTSSKKNSISSRTGLEPRSSPDVFSLGFPQNPDKLFLRNLDPLEGIFSGAWIHVCKQDDWSDDEELSRSDLSSVQWITGSKIIVRTLQSTLAPHISFKIATVDGLENGGGLVVSVLAFYSDDPSSNPPGNLNFLYEKMKINKKEAGVCSILKNNTLKWSKFTLDSKCFTCHLVFSSQEQRQFYNCCNFSKTTKESQMKCFFLPAKVFSRSSSWSEDRKASSSTELKIKDLRFVNREEKEKESFTRVGPRMRER